MDHHGITHQAILNLVPQQAPFRFIDDIIQLNADGIIGRYTYKTDESFYVGHFPGKPVTPGVILLETMAQTGVVAYGIYLLAQEIGLDSIDQWLTLFTDAEVEFSKSVLPGETVDIHAEKIFWRRMKLKVTATMFNEKGEQVAASTISGLGVKRT